MPLSIGSYFNSKPALQKIIKDIKKKWRELLSKKNNNTKNSELLKGGQSVEESRLMKIKKKMFLKKNLFLKKFF